MLGAVTLFRGKGNPATAGLSCRTLFPGDRQFRRRVNHSEQDLAESLTPILPGENLRSLDGQKPGFCSKARRVFRPVCPRSSLSQLNFIWGRKTSVDSEISIIDFLGVECRKYRERESKKKRISSAHKDCPPRT